MADIFDTMISTENMYFQLGAKHLIQVQMCQVQVLKSQVQVQKSIKSKFKKCDSSRTGVQVPNLSYNYPGYVPYQLSCVYLSVTCGAKLFVIIISI